MTADYLLPGQGQSWHGRPLQELPLTGERTVPGVPAENYWFRRHEVVYEHVRGLLRPSDRVLEVGCGEGYGSALLASTGATVLGIDYDELAIAHCGRTYAAASFARANLAALPAASGSVDAVVTLQVIEHVWDIPQFVDECRRVLRPGGLLVVSTPNRLTFSPGHDGTRPPDNPFHTHEFVAVELAGLLAARGMREVSMAGLHAGPRLAELQLRYGSFVGAQLACPPAQWSAQLTADVASISTCDFVVRPETGPSFPVTDASLDLLVTARR